MTEHQQQFNPQSVQILWEGQSNDLTHLATGGRLTTAAYRLTSDALYFASGVISSREESIPLWAIHDADITQTITQKARGVADLTLRMDTQSQARFGQQAVVLRSIRDAREVRNLMLVQANQNRAYWANYQHQQNVEQARAGAATVTIGQSETPQSTGSDLLAQLTKLGEMRTAGLLTEDEFVSAKGLLLGS